MNSPKPLVEEHYHIQSLIEGQEKRSAERTYHQEVEKKRDQALKDIAEYKDIETLDFWCTPCKVDFIGRAKKQVDNWQPIAYYKIKHTCGQWSMRRITERADDLYFYKSNKVAWDRGLATVDMLQSFESGYNMVYGKK